MTFFSTPEPVACRRLTVAGLLCASAVLTSCAALRVPTIHYFVPKKEFTANVTYTLVVRKDYKKYVPKKTVHLPARKAKPGRPAMNGKPAVRAITALPARDTVISSQAASLLRARVTECTIASATDVAIVPRLVPDEQRILRIPAKFFKGKTKVGVTFDANAPGFIGAINTEQTPATAEIITGVGDILGSVIGGAAKILGGKADLAVVPEDSTVYQTVKVVRMYDITPIFTTTAAGTSLSQTLSAADIRDGVKEIADDAQCVLQVQEFCLQNRLPQLTFAATALAPTPTPAMPAGAPTVSSTAVYYRSPAYYKLQVSLVHNGLTPTQQIVENVFNVPQQGGLDSISVGASKRWKGRRTVVAKFDNTAGTLAEYSLETEGQLSSILTKSGAALDKVSAGVQSLQDVRTSRLEQEVKRITAEASLLKAQQELLKLQNPVP